MLMLHYLDVYVVAKLELRDRVHFVVGRVRRAVGTVKAVKVPHLWSDVCIGNTCMRSVCMSKKGRETQERMWRERVGESERMKEGDRVIQKEGEQQRCQLIIK